MDSWQPAAAVLRLGSQLVDGVQDGLARRGFSDVRPAHGFAFVRIGGGDATTADVAEHLGITKQAASQTEFAFLQAALITIVAPGPLRPSW